MATDADARPRHLGDFDAVVIGAGIVGAMIARELSGLKGRFAIVEKEMFPGFGVSKASLAQIHLPDFCPPGSLKGQLCKNAPERFKGCSYIYKPLSETSPRKMMAAFALRLPVAVSRPDM